MTNQHESTVSERVVFVTRQGCSLCAPALGIVRGVCAELGEEMRIVDLDENPTYARFAHDIPVVLVDGEVHSRWSVRSADLRAALLAGKPWHVRLTTRLRRPTPR